MRLVPTARTGVCVLSLLTSACGFAAEWQQIASLPEPNGGFMAGAIGSRIVVAGGTNWQNDTKRWLRTTWVLDPTTSHWQPGPDLPHPLAYAACASDGNTLWIAGGTDGVAGRTEIWSLNASLQLTRIGDLPEPALYAGGAIVGNRLQLLGGTPEIDGWGKVTSSSRAVDLRSGQIVPGNSLPGLPGGIGIPALAAAGNRLFSFGGAWLDPVSSEVTNVAAAFEQDSARNRWKAVASLPRPVRGLSAVALDRRTIYLAGGYGSDEDGFLKSAFVYDVEQDCYHPAVPLPFAALTCLVPCDAYVYAIAGEDRQKHRTAVCWRIPAATLRIR